jgi:hypothetical protein
MLTKSRSTRIEIAEVTKNPAINDLLVCLFYYFHIAMQWKQIWKISLKRPRATLRASKNATGRESYKSYREIVSYYNTSEISLWV